MMIGTGMGEWRTGWNVELVCVRVWNVGMLEFWGLRSTWKLVYIDYCCCCDG